MAAAAARLALHPLPPLERVHALRPAELALVAARAEPLGDQLRVGVRAREKAPVERFTREIAPLVLTATVNWDLLAIGLAVALFRPAAQRRPMAAASPPKRRRQKP